MPWWDIGSGVAHGPYYVVQDMKTKTCTVTEKKPAATETTVSVVNGVVYKTKTEAEGAIKTITTCTTK